MTDTSDGRTRHPRGSHVTVFDPQDLYALLRPVVEQVDNERQALNSFDRGRDSEASALTVLSNALHQAIMLGFLISAVRRDTEVTTTDVEHRLQVLAADAETRRLLGIVTGGA